jgi:shikimate dehydrogenase
MLEQLNGETRLFPIIGDPIIYVKSPERLTSGFAARGHNGICVPMQVPQGALESVMPGASGVRIANAKVKQWRSSGSGIAAGVGLRCSE